MKITSEHINPATHYSVLSNALLMLRLILVVGVVISVGAFYCIMANNDKSGGQVSIPKFTKVVLSSQAQVSQASDAEPVVVTGRDTNGYTYRKTFDLDYADTDIFGLAVDSDSDDADKTINRAASQLLGDAIKDGALTFWYYDIPKKDQSADVYQHSADTLIVTDPKKIAQAIQKDKDFNKEQAKLGQWQKHPIGTTFNIGMVLGLTTFVMMLITIPLRLWGEYLDANAI